MNIVQIEENLQGLIKEYNKEEFLYDLLLAYGLPKASITRLKKGSYDLSDHDNVVSWKKKVYFKEEHDSDLHKTLMELAGQVKHGQRFIIVTDYETFLARDTKTKENLDIPIEDLPKHYDFFLPWAGMEKMEHQNENPADVKAAERMAKLFDEIKKDNPDDSPEFIHGLNVFLSRLLFCFFAEDTDIFPEGQFTNGVASHTQADGSDLHTYLDKLFDVLNTKKSDRAGIPAYLDAFPYVNGGLFKDKISSPVFTKRSRQAIIDSGELNWSAINPDIFGSMMQAVITPEHRGGLGMHYTSVPNIMKVIKPLFLDGLYNMFEKGQNEPKKLITLLDRISKIKIFDPACGSGNFLIIAYKELRRLEMKIIRRLIELQKLAQGFKAKQEQLSIIPNSQLELAESYQIDLFSRVQLSQFYGIELDDFAHEIAQLSLWLAEHQMNVEFYDEFGRMNPTLPLKEAGNIVHGNACRIDWETVCPKNEDDEIYILGNPPYLGDKVQSESQKKELALVFKGSKKIRSIDYIAAWFKKASEFINQKSEFAFVTTNSINQGVQVPLLWPRILGNDKEISFAHQNFPWKNNAKKKAAVICSIIGIRHKSNQNKYLYTEATKRNVENINAYLISGRNIIIDKHSSSISGLPLMTTGNIARDRGHLMLSDSERNKLIQDYPETKKVIKRIVGSSELLNDKIRWCLWIEDEDLKEIRNLPPIKERLNKIKQYRINGSKRGQAGIDTPHKFERTLRCRNNQIVIPRVSSQRREYIPISFLSSEYIISDAALVVFDPKPYIFGVISSRMHMVWVNTVAGRLKNDFRYSAGVCYNSFPFPTIGPKRESEINQCVFRILDEREKYSNKTLAELYDPNKMSTGLLEAHQANDEVIEKCYRSRPFESDEQRLEYLFKMYEEMIEVEKQKATLFEKQKKN